MPDNGFVSEADLLQSARKTIEISGARKVSIGRISKITIALAINGIPDLSMLALAAQEKRTERITPAQAVAAIKAIDQILIAGVQVPKLHASASEGATPADLEDADRLLLYNAILDISGWNKAAAEAVLPLSKTSA